MLENAPVRQVNAAPYCMQLWCILEFLAAFQSQSPFETAVDEMDKLQIPRYGPVSVRIQLAEGAQCA
jgi:hypothetical protein